MSKQKSCYICGGLVDTMYYGDAGSMGWMCEDCAVSMQDRFKRIFGVQVFGTTAGSDLSISLEDLSKVLGMIHRNVSMLRYEIDDQDRCIAGVGGDLHYVPDDEHDSDVVGLDRESLEGVWHPGFDDLWGGDSDE